MLSIWLLHFISIQLRLPECLPTLCQVLCCEIGYTLPFLKDETVIPQVIGVVIEGCAGGCGGTGEAPNSVGIREHDA